jgi:hypothetical protein
VKCTPLSIEETCKNFAWLGTLGHHHFMLNQSISYSFVIEVHVPDEICLAGCISQRGLHPYRGPQHWGKEVHNSYGAVANYFDWLHACWHPMLVLGPQSNADILGFM